MYATCLFCHRPLGDNALIESFPIGRRLAFDAERGRLWVVCARCGRWNLTPIEERWDAIEDCERRFRDTTLRASTDNVGLARFAGGVELIRIGRPLRPEFAAWRYGPELLRRRRYDLLGGAAAVGSGVAMVAGTAAAALVVGPAAVVGVPLLYATGAVAVVRALSKRVVARVHTVRGTVRIRALHLPSVRFVPPSTTNGLHLQVDSDGGPVLLTDQAATSLASVACARRNQTGATASAVRAAVERIESGAGPEGILGRVGEAGALRQMRFVERLALEMALHEESERRALSGELASLEAAWKEAEEIAEIADSLLLPEKEGGTG